MSKVFHNVWLVISTAVLAGGFMILFFGGTWEGVRFGLEILGGVFVVKIAYSVVSGE